MSAISFDSFVDENREAVCWVNQYSEYYRAQYLAFPITIATVQENVHLLTSQKSRFLQLPDFVKEKTPLDLYGASPDEGLWFTKTLHDAADLVYGKLLGYAKNLPFKSYIYDEASVVVADTTGKIIFLIEQPNNLFPDSTVDLLLPTIQSALEQYVLLKWWTMARVEDEAQASGILFDAYLSNITTLLGARVYPWSKRWIPIWAETEVAPVTSYSVQFTEYVCQSDDENIFYEIVFDNNDLDGSYVFTCVHPLDTTLLSPTWYDGDGILQQVQGVFTTVDVNTVTLSCGGPITGLHTLQLRKYIVNDNQYAKEFTNADLTALYQLPITHSLNSRLLNVAWYDNTGVLQIVGDLYKALTVNTSLLSCNGTITGTHVIILSNE